MRILVLGGTVFVSRTIAATAVRRGHDVVCAARGESGSVPEGARLVPIDRNAPDGLAELARERFEAVVDVAKMSLRWVRAALTSIEAEHWTFVSSINVYADVTTPGSTADAALLDGITEERDDLSIESYGGIKVASENAVRDVMGERAMIIRPGLVTGPDDGSDRFGYWPNRLSRGGRVVVPDAPDQAFQHIDVRDLAEWIIEGAEQRRRGTYDGVGPVTRLGPVLEEIRSLVAPEGTEFVPLGRSTLEAAGVECWSGPKSLPLWVPATHPGLLARDGSAARLRSRPLADTVRAALATERALGLDRPRKAGLTAEEEAELLEVGT